MIIDIPKVGQVEFPDSMSEADINKAAKKLYDEANVEPKKEKGRNWRQSISKIYELPKVEDGKNPLDFECPFGLVWKEDPKINNIKSVDINSKVKISRDTGSRNARDCNCSRNK